VYAVLTSDEEKQFDLVHLRDVTERIAHVCKLDWFSTEIAFTNDDKFVVVDYVNDSIDTRIQSKAADGVPDEIIWMIAERLVMIAKKD